ncbi:MAG: hypothetical protein ACR2M7_01490 [Bdellovibrionales bacterium]
MVSASQLIGKFKPSKEERAFVYQKASELNAPVVIYMDQNKKKYSVTFLIDTSFSNLKVKGEGLSVVEACMKAQKEAQKKMSYLIKEDHDLERDFLIDLMKQNIKIH